MYGPGIKIPAKMVLTEPMHCPRALKPIVRVHLSGTMAVNHISGDCNQANEYDEHEPCRHRRIPLEQAVGGTSEPPPADAKIGLGAANDQLFIASHQYLILGSK